MDLARFGTASATRYYQPSYNEYNSFAALDNIIAFFEERLLPVDEFQAFELAKEVIASPPEIGYFTISNAL